MDILRVVALLQFIKFATGSGCILTQCAKSGLDCIVTSGSTVQAVVANPKKILCPYSDFCYYLQINSTGCSISQCANFSMGNCASNGWVEVLQAFSDTKCVSNQCYKAQICGDGYFANTTSFTCNACGDACQTCQSQVYCTQCQQGFTQQTGYFTSTGTWCTSGNGNTACGGSTSTSTQGSKCISNTSTGSSSSASTSSNGGSSGAASSNIGSGGTSSTSTSTSSSTSNTVSQTGGRSMGLIQRVTWSLILLMIFVAY